jgi:hypothetical protein
LRGKNGWSISSTATPLLDEDILEALRRETVRDIARESSTLPEREMGLVLGIIRQFGDQQEAVDG